MRRPYELPRYINVLLELTIRAARKYSESSIRPMGRIGYGSRFFRLAMKAAHFPERLQSFPRNGVRNREYSSPSSMRHNEESATGTMRDHAWKLRRFSLIALEIPGLSHSRMILLEFA